MEAINWKQDSKIITHYDINTDNLETLVLEEMLIGLEAYVCRWGRDLSKAIRVKYEKGMLKPLEKVDFREGEELVVFVRRRRVREVLDKYVGLFGKADVEELKLLEEEAQVQ